MLKRLLLGFVLVTTLFTLVAEDAALPERDANLLVLLSDLHTGAKSAYQGQKFAAILDEILAMRPLPAQVLLMGDVAYLQGDDEDYAVLKPMLQRLTAAGISWTAAMGNHDRRENYSKNFPEQVPALPLVPGRQVTVVRTPRADFIMLDSLLDGKVNGELDEPQRQWLTGYLATLTKPTFVCAHHPLNESKLGPLLAATPLVPAYIFGHHHRWEAKTVEGVKTLCLPSTGHWGDIGFVVVALSDDGAKFTLQARDYFTPRPLPEPKPEWTQRLEKLRGASWSLRFATPAQP